MLSKILLTSNQCDSVISNTKQENHKRPLLKEMISAKNGKTFSTIMSTIMSLEYILINWRIALSEVKHPLLGKRQALSNSLNAALVHISFKFVLAATKGKDIFMNLTKGGRLCPLTSSLTSSIILQSFENLQQKAKAV